MPEDFTPEIVRIENWSTIVRENPYQAPELVLMCLHGKVYGHPFHEEGTEVATSPITEVNGREVKTSSRTYLLGEVSPDFEKWYREESTGKCDLTSYNPFKEKSEKD